MPKVSRVGKFRAAAKSSSPSAPPKESPNENNEASDKSSSLSRGQRKRLAKREQYMKREKMILSSLRLQKLQEEKGRLDGFEAVRLSLPEYTKVPKSNSDVKTKSVVVSNSNKSKKTICNREISHMGLVLEHPAFKQNPFETIQQHLRNTLADDAIKLQQDSVKVNQEEEMELCKKREAKKERIRDAKFSKGHKNARRKR